MVVAPAATLTAAGLLVSGSSSTDGGGVIDVGSPFGPSWEALRGLEGWSFIIVERGSTVARALQSVVPGDVNISIEVYGGGSVGERYAD